MNFRISIPESISKCQIPIRITIVAPCRPRHGSALYGTHVWQRRVLLRSEHQVAQLRLRLLAGPQQRPLLHVPVRCGNGQGLPAPSSQLQPRPAQRRLRLHVCGGGKVHRRQQRDDCLRYPADLPALSGGVWGGKPVREGLRRRRTERSPSGPGIEGVQRLEIVEHIRECKEPGAILVSRRDCLRHVRSKRQPPVGGEP